MKPRSKRMKLVTKKIKLPQTTIDAMSLQVIERNDGKNPEEQIDDEYLASEVLQKYFQ